jgi:hypothetical protein
MSQMDERNAAQAVVLVRALRDLLDEMTRRLVWLEHHGSRLEAAALQRDIHEAQAHINRLQRKYLSGESTKRRFNPLDNFGDTGPRASGAAD